MIMTKKDEGTYKQIGFIYRNDEIDVSGEVPVDFKTTNGIIGDYTIKGNAYQSDRVSPDTPQEVKAVGDRTGNLFDYKKYFESTFTKYNDYFEGAEIQLKPFTTYTFTTSFGESTISTGIVNTAFIIATSTEEPRTVNGGISSTRIRTKTTEADGIIKIYKRIRGNYLPKKEDFDSGMHWLMINEGDTALPYEPYGYKIPIVTRGKNLLEPIGFSAEIITNINDYRKKTNTYGTSLSTVYGGSVLVTQTNQIDTTTSYVNGVFYIVVDFSKFTTGKNYILSFDYEIKEKHSVQGNSIAYIGNSTSPTKIYGDWGKDGRKSATFTVREGFKPYIAIRLCGNSIFVSNIQIEEGTTATPYEPYHEPITTPIYLDSPLYKIGDYADRLSKTEEVRVVKELVLTGKEDIFYGDAYTRFRVNIADFETFGVRATPFYMSHYIVVSDGRPLPDVPDNAAYSGSSSDNHCIFIKTTNYTTVADFKSYLAAQYAAGTPVTVYYVLAEPETKSIILPKIPTLDGTNIIDINTEIKPSNISLSRPMTEIKKILNKEGKILFEKGFTREVESILPLTLNGINKPLKNYTIYGNTLQNGTPTPENPVEVQAVGDRTGNLFDNSLLEQGGWKATAGTIPTKLLPGETNYTYRTRYNQIIPLLASTLSLYCPANIKINYVWIDANGISLGGSGYQKNGDTATAPEQAVSMTFILGLDSDIECTPSDFSDINLVAGSIAPESYEPYGYKIPVVTRGKNLWYLQSSYSFTTFYNINVNINAGHYLSYIIETNGTTGSHGETGCQLTFSDNTTQYVLFNANYRTSIFLSKDVKIVRVYAGKDYNTSIGATATVSKIMVSANADDSYEPYHEPITTPIYLPTPLYSGEVIRSDGSRDVKWGKIVLTGEEKIAFAGTAGTSYRYDFTNIKTISQLTYARKNSKITHFEQCNMPTIDVVGYDWHGGSFHLMIVTTQSTINKFKDWLKSQYAAGTPVTVWYQLAKPTTEIFTAPQIPTLNGTTVIDVDTAVKPTEMYTKYKSSK